MGTFFFVLGFYKGFQACQTGLPENTILFQPQIDGLQRAWIELVKAMTAFTSFFDEMSFTQLTEMFRNGRPRNRKGSRYLTRWQTALPQEVEHGATGGIGQGAERFRLICNRSVSHNV
jgi:hypothetical protein